MKPFTHAPLAEVAEVISGYAFKSVDLTRKSEDIPVLKIANVTPPVATLIFYDHFPPKLLTNKLSKYVVKNHDVLVAMTGMGSVGRIAIAKGIDKKILLNQRVGIIRAKQNIYDQNFLGSVLTAKHYEKILYDLGIGAGQPNVSPKDIESLQVPLAHPSTQRKIAAILTAYDDLIETNKRRIALLEKMAEELYREWFVRMRFPGYQTTKFVKGVPEGWELVKVEKAFDFTGGGTPSKSVASYWNEETVQWFTPTDITGSAGIYLTESAEKCSDEGVTHSSAKLFPAYSVMMTSRATIGAIGINTTEACTNQGFITCLPNARYPLPYLYHWLKLAKPYFEQLCGGATFPELTKGTFKKLSILTPPQSIADSFAQIVNPLMQSVENILAANRNLTQTRDLLLPRLISGKLSVEDLDIQLPPSMREEAG